MRNLKNDLYNMDCHESEKTVIQSYQTLHTENYSWTLEWDKILSDLITLNW